MDTKETKNQHYVSRYYLKYWLTTRGKAARA
jgi:hypothetical protein